MVTLTSTLAGFILKVCLVKCPPRTIHWIETIHRKERILHVEIASYCSPDRTRVNDVCRLLPRAGRSNQLNQERSTGSCASLVWREPNNHIQRREFRIGHCL